MVNFFSEFWRGWHFFFVCAEKFCWEHGWIFYIMLPFTGAATVLFASFSPQFRSMIFMLIHSNLHTMFMFLLFTSELLWLFNLLYAWIQNVSRSSSRIELPRIACLLTVSFPVVFTMKWWNILFVFYFAAIIPILLQCFQFFEVGIGGNNIPLVFL